MNGVYTDEAFELRACARGCTNPDGTNRIAKHGEYCNRCWGRLDSALAQAGELTLHLLANAMHSSGGADEKIQTSRESPLPFNHAAFDDANELYSMLTYWVSVWAGHLGETVTLTGWRTETGKIIGLPAGTIPDDGARNVANLARWVRNRLDGILATRQFDDIDAFDEAIRDVWRMNARWPRIERPSYSPMPCPREDCKRKIAVYPPTFPGDTRRVVCQGGHWYPEDEYEHLILVFKEGEKDRRQVAKTAAHLAKKYGLGAR